MGVIVGDVLMVWCAVMTELMALMWWWCGDGAVAGCAAGDGCCVVSVGLFMVGVLSVVVRCPVSCMCYLLVFGVVGDGCPGWQCGDDTVLVGNVVVDC